MIEAIDPTPAAVGLSELVRNFQKQQRRLELSPETVRSYDSPLLQFVRYMNERSITTTDQLTRPLISAWQESLKDREIDASKRNARRHLQPATRSLYSIAVRQLLAYAAGEELIDLRLTLALARVKVRRGLPRPIPPADLARISAYLERKATRRKLTGLRTRALFWYLITTGARISEALQVTRQAAGRLLGTESATARVTRKGGSEGLLVCPASVVMMLREYLDVRHDESPWLWVNHAEGGWAYLKNEPPVQLTPTAVNECWKRIAKRARVKAFTSHQCRHTAATQMLAADIPVTAIAEHLGHADLRQISTYAQVDVHHRQGAVNAMDRLVRQHRP